MAQGAETRQQAAQAPLPFFVAAFRRHPGTPSAFRRFCTPLRPRLCDVGHAWPPEKLWRAMKKMLFITAFGLFLAADGAVAGMTLSPPGHARVVRDRVLVAVPLIAHTLAFERLILGGRNFQFLVSKVAPDPVPKHLDI